MLDFKKTIVDMARSKRGRMILIALALGIVLLLSSLLMQGVDKEEYSSGNVSLEEYKAALESELGELCSSVAGVGKAKVMVTFDAGAEYQYKNGNLISSAPPRVKGITVICRGGDKDSVRAELSDMLCALFEIGKNRICVLKLKT